MISHQDISFRVLVINDLHHIPAAHIIPAKITGQYQHIIRTLQNTIINRNLWNYRIHFLDHAIFIRRIHGITNCRQAGINIRKQFRKFFQNSGCFPYEHTAVPGIVPALHIGLCRLIIWFFLKFLYLAGNRILIFIKFDITISGRREGRRNTDCNQLVLLLGCLNGLIENFCKFWFIFYKMIRREDTHDTITVFFHDLHRCITDAGCCISRRRLCQNMIFGNSAIHTLQHLGCLLFIGNDENIFLLHGIVQAVDGLINHPVLTA